MNVRSTKFKTSGRFRSRAWQPNSFTCIKFHSATNTRRSRRGTKFTAFLGRKMLRNLVVCYSIATELKPKCPTCTQLMSFLALRKTFCFESQCFVDWKPRKERTLPSSRCFAFCKEQRKSSFIVLRIKFVEKSVKRQAHYFFGLVRLDSRLLHLDPRYSMHASFEDQGLSRGSRLERDCQLTFKRYCIIDYHPLSCAV